MSINAYLMNLQCKFCTLDFLMQMCQKAVWTQKILPFVTALWSIFMQHSSFGNKMLYISTSYWVLHIPNTGRNMLFQRFSANKTLHPHSGANFKKTFFAKFCIKFLVFFLFSTFYTNFGVWSAQFTNAGQNIQ